MKIIRANEDLIFEVDYTCSGREYFMIDSKTMVIADQEEEMDFHYHVCESCKKATKHHYPESTCSWHSPWYCIKCMREISFKR